MSVINAAAVVELFF